MAAITQEFMDNMDLGRLQRAARGLQDGSLNVVVEGQDEDAVWGLVRNGGDKCYSVQVAHGYASCECPDWSFRHQHGLNACKHALALVLAAVREQPREGECDHKAPYGSVTGCEKCGSKYLHEGEPNLKLARVREGFCG